MKRRLFIKRSGMAAAGLVAAPYLLESCSGTAGAVSSKQVFISDPASVPDFQKYACMFDEAAAELRLFGAGPLVPAEAEAFNFGLDDVAEQLYSGAEAPAELNAEFAEFGSEMIDAAEGLFESSESFEVIAAGSSEFLGTAENYSLLKVSKSTAVLHSAAQATFPQPEREPRVRDMYAESEIMYQALAGEFEGSETNNAELRFGAEHLLGNAELYVGSSNMLSGSQEYLFATAELSVNVGNSDDLLEFAQESAAGTQAASAQLGGNGQINLTKLKTAVSNLVSSFKDDKSFGATKGADFLLAEATSIELSSQQQESGFELFNQGESVVGGAEEQLAEAWIKPSESLIKTSENYLTIAQGEAAELGAERMLEGASELLASSETLADDLFIHGETFLWGAEQYIGGTTNFHGSVKYKHGAEQYTLGASLLARGAPSEIAFEMLAEGAEHNLSGSEEFEIGAEALTFIQAEGRGDTAEGAVNVGPAAEFIYKGAESLLGIAEQGNAKNSAFEMLAGAERMITGAETAIEDGAELIIGSEELVDGSAEVWHGLEGYMAAE